MDQEEVSVSAEDLSAGTLSDADSKDADLGLKEQQHRFSTERTLFNSVLCFAAILYMAAMVFGGILLYSLQTHPEIHWHASLLIGGFIVPPTVICVALIRGVYSKEKAVAASSSDAKEEPFPMPAAELFKEFAKEIGKEMGAVFKGKG